MFPGHKAGTQYSFGDPKGEAREHEVTHSPKSSAAHGKYRCTIAEYSNIEGGEKGEKGVHHIHHSKHHHK